MARLVLCLLFGWCALLGGGGGWCGHGDVSSLVHVLVAGIVEGSVMGNRYLHETLHWGVIVWSNSILLLSFLVVFEGGATDHSPLLKLHFSFHIVRSSYPTLIRQTNQYPQ